MSSDNVPLDIWREVLVRLPGESLLRFRAVCKGWRAVIDDPPFVRAHHQQLVKKNIIIIRRNSTFCYSLDLEALSFSNGQQTIAATPLDSEALTLIRDRPEWRSGVSACNGLILTQKPLQIWNPLTHERLDLPPRDFVCSTFGLGYDHITDDYKAVVILSRRLVHEFYGKKRSTRKTLVYSLKADSWRRSTNCPWAGDWRGPDGAGVFVCGALNWLSVGKGGVYDDKIMSFDLGTEKYRLLQMPHAMVGGSKVPGKLLDVFGGSLILCVSCSFGFLDVWVMKDYGDEASWIKLLSMDEKQYDVPRLWGLLRPVAFIAKEEDNLPQVFLQAEGGVYGFRFFLFDVETSSLKRVFIHGYDLDLRAHQMFPATIFPLHANCDGARQRKIATGGTRTKEAAADLDQLVFCIRDHARWDDDDQDSCGTSQATKSREW